MDLTKDGGVNDLDGGIYLYMYISLLTYLSVNISFVLTAFP